MLELLENLELLKNTMEKDERIKETKQLQRDINNDKELINLINLYKDKPNIQLKYQIYENNNYKKYKELENEIKFLILDINKHLKEIKGSAVCESNRR